MSEIIFLAILALIIIGPKELPQVARTVGRFLNELKRSSNILSDEIKQHTRFDQFDLNSPLPRSRKPEENAIQEELAKSEPEQMEFNADEPVDETDIPKKEDKPS